MSQIFMIKCDVEGLEKTILPEHITGAYVICITQAKSFEIAAERVVLHLKNDGLFLKEIFNPISTLNAAWSVYVSESWAEYADRLMDDEEFDEVMKSSGVVYSPFLEYDEGMKQNAYDGHFQ